MCFTDYRRPERVEQTVGELIRQRMYPLVLGYEDLNDHDQLRRDPLLAVLAGKSDLDGSRRRRERGRGNPGTDNSTFNRLELTPKEADEAARYKKTVMKEETADGLPVQLYIQAQERKPEHVVLDLDATDDPIHAEQEASCSYCSPLSPSTSRHSSMAFRILLISVSRDFAWVWHPPSSGTEPTK